MIYNFVHIPMIFWCAIGCPAISNYYTSFNYIFFFIKVIYVSALWSSLSRGHNKIIFIALRPRQTPTLLPLPRNCIFDAQWASRLSRRLHRHLLLASDFQASFLLPLNRNFPSTLVPLNKCKQLATVLWVLFFYSQYFTKIKISLEA